MSFKPVTNRIVLALLVLAGLSASPSSAATSEFQILVNRDLNPASGCDLTPPPAGSPQAARGLEQILTATVTTGPGTATVSSITSKTCTVPATNTFGAATPVSGSLGAVGQNNGTNGFDVVEFCVPASVLGSGPPPQARIGLLSSNLVGGTDQLMTPNGNGNQPIFLPLGFTPPIPTLSEWGLILMALLLAAAAATRLRKRPTAALAIFFVLAMAGVAVAVTVDGQIGDWAAGDKLGDDPIGDAPLGADIRALFGKYENNQVCFRIDASLDIPPPLPPNNPPTVQPAIFSIPENSANGTVVGTVVATDTDAGQTLTYSITGGNTGLAFAINATTGEITVVNSAALNFETTPTFTLTVTATDNGTPAASGTGTVTINLTNVNEAPVAVNDSFSVAEGGTLNQPAPGVLSNDSDPEGNTLTTVLDSGPTHGTLTLNPNGSFTYTHDGSETPPTDTFTYHVTDGTSNSNVATVTITITGDNDAPTAVNDSYSVDEGGTLTQAVPGVLANDTDPEGNTLTAVLDSGPAHGTLTLNPNGSFTYTHDGSETPTTDTFTYHANDGTSNSNVATVTITINPINEAPVAVNDSFGVAEGGTLTQAAPGVLANDTDPEGSTLTAVLDSGPAHGTLTLNADGSFTYTHDGSETPPTDTFTYHVTDGTLSSNVATVTITITGANDAPVATNDSFSVTEGGTLTQPAPGVLANDLDADGNALTAVLDSGPAHGTLTLNADGSFTYTHDGSETPATDTFTYHANDGAANSNVATVTITITSVNDAPVLDLDADDSGGTTGADFAITFADGDPAKLIEDPTDATITDADTTTLTTLTVTLTNLLDTGFEVLDVDLTGADPAFTKTYDTTTDPTKGVLTITASPARPIAEFVALLRKVTYVNTDDNPDTSAARVIQFVVSDGTSNSNTATTTVTITAANDAPVAGNDSYSVNEGGTLNQPLPGVLANDTDPEGDTLTAVLDSGPAHGTLTLNANGSFTYTHDGSETPTTDTFTYHANDGTANSNVATVTITINAVNDAPTAVSDSFSVNEGGTLNQAAPGVLANDTDPEGTTLTAVLNAGPAHASSFTLNPNGSFTYVHDGSETPTTDTFTYHANDGTADSNIVTVTITINPVNDSPTAVGDSYNVNEGATLNTPAPGVLANDSDPEGSALTAVLNTGPAHGTLTLNPNGSFTYTHDGSETPLTDSFTYHANDGTANSNIVTVTITINPVNDAPIAVSDSYNVNEGGTLNQAAPGVLGNDTDAEGNTLIAVLNTGPAHGTLTLNPNGSFTYTHDGSETPLSDSFTYHANDGTADSNIVTVTITINPVNDPPVANPDTADITEEAPNVPAANTVSGNVLTNDTDPDSSLTVSAVAGGSVGAPRAGSFGSVVINSNGSFTYTLDDTNPTVNALRPGDTRIDLFTYTASDGSLTSSSTLTVTIHGADDPATPDNDAFDFIGNTELRVDLAAGSTPTVLETTPSTFGVADGDVDPEGDPITIAGIVGCADLTAPFDCVIAGQGTVSLQADGRFSFVPEAGDTDATATFQYTLVGNPAPATVTLTRFERVWYVKNDAPAGGLGRSNDPFDTLAEAQTASLANDYIFVYFGDGTATGQSAGIALKNGQHLIGQHTGLSLPVNLNGNGAPTNLVPAAAGSRPLLNDTTVDAIEGVSANNVLPAEIVGLNLAGNVNAIDWTTTAAFAGTGNTFSIRDNVIRSATNEGVDINLAGTSAVSLAFHDNTITSTGTGLDIQETGTGSLTITQFANNAVTGTTGGTGINIANAIFDATPGGGINPVSGGTTVIGASGDPVGGGGLVISGMSGTLNFTDLDIFAGGGTGLGVAGTGPATTNFTVGAGVGIVEANGGPAVNVSQATVDLQFTSIKSTGSPGTGVSLDTVDGTFSAGSGSSIATATGTDFNVNAGMATISYAGTINNTAGRSVNVTNRTGTNSVTFSGAITDNGTGILISANSANTTTEFTGGLTMSTGANAAFTATNGGILRVTGAANTITTTTATALNVTGTTIHSDDLTFRSISSNGGSSTGIILSGTGSSGNLVVTGTGGAGTGGTIANKSGTDGDTATGIGIYLNNTQAPSFSNMQLNDFGNFAIRGTGVTGFSLSGTTINGANGNNGALNEGSVSFDGLTGSASIASSNISGGFEDNLRIVNTTGSLNRVTVSGTTIGLNSTTNGNNGVLLEAMGAGTVLNATISTSTFTGARADWVNAAAQTGASMDFVFTGNTLTNTHPSTGSGGARTVIAGTGTMTYQVSGNNFRGSSGSPVFANAANSTAVLSGRIENNVIGLAGTANSGSSAGSGIQVETNGGGDHTVLINNNQVRQYNNHGILLVAGDSMGNPVTFNATVTNNTIANPGSINTNFNGIHLNNGTTAVDNFTSCVDIRSNSIAGSGTGTVAPNNADFRLRQRQSTSVRLPGYGGANNNDAAVVAFVSGNNTVSTGAASNTVPTGGGFIGGAACPQP